MALFFLDRKNETRLVLDQSIEAFQSSRDRFFADA
jgi:hypothetical protein